jgi:hypothetical protein
MSHVVAAAQTHSTFSDPLIYVLVVIVVGLMLLWQGVLWHNRRDSRTPERDKPLGAGNPADLSPGMRAWRRRRTAAGKGDNWLTRPLIRIDATGKNPPVEFLPDDHEPKPRLFASRYKNRSALPREHSAEIQAPRPVRKKGLDSPERTVVPHVAFVPSSRTTPPGWHGPARRSPSPGSQPWPRQTTRSVSISLHPHRIDCVIRVYIRHKSHG